MCTLRSIFTVSSFATVLAQPAGQATGTLSSISNSSDSCSDGPLDSYNVGFHVAGIFIVLIVSGLGMFGALFLGSASTLPSVEQAIQIFKMFGTGVIAATAWIHLLPDAFSQFSSPCLQGYWNVYGTNYVGLFGLTSAFLVQLVEMGIGAHGDTGQALDLPPPTSELNEHVIVGSLTHIELALPDRPVVESGDKLGKVAQRLQTIVLEGGILTHSIIIGITLGVTPDVGFTTLLIAICFHQVRHRSRT